MKRLLPILFVLFFVSSSGFAQSDALRNQIELDKNEASREGYTLLDSGGGETNYDWVLTFDPDVFYSGYIYHVIVYIEGCSYCDVGMYFQNTSNGVVEELTPTIQRASGVVQAVYRVQQDKTAYGTLSAYAKSDKKVYTYSMLFRKPTY